MYTIRREEENLVGIQFDWNRLHPVRYMWSRLTGTQE